MTQKGYKPKQEITHFYCRPCVEYHHKEHPHFEEMKERKRKRKREAKRSARLTSTRQ